MTANLTPDEVSLWRGFLQWSEETVALIAADLASGSTLSVSDFEVAVRLRESDDGLLQSDLGLSLSWSASRLSHQLGRMERRGLIARTSAGHGRSVRVALTERGRSELEAATVVHAESVRAHFLSALDSSAVSVMRRLGAENDSGTHSGTDSDGRSRPGLDTKE